MKCPLCQKRKGRRHCPATKALICSHCCGTKRRVEVRCPEDCVYLQGAHAGAWEGRTTEKERDQRRLAPFASGLTDAQRELFIVSMVGLAAIGARRADVTDRLLSEAVGTLRKTIETRDKGILYDHQADDARAQALVHEIANLYEERDTEGRRSAPSDSDLLAVLKALESALGATIAEAGDARAFLETIARVTAGAVREPQEHTPRLILP
jgi:hypothetical protein